MSLPKIYYTDDYPREGCTIAIEVDGSSFSVLVYPPKDMRRDIPLEVYHAESLDYALMIVRSWLSGEPRAALRESALSYRKKLAG